MLLLIFVLRAAAVHCSGGAVAAGGVHAARWRTRRRANSIKNPYPGGPEQQLRNRRLFSMGELWANYGRTMGEGQETPRNLNFFVLLQLVFFILRVSDFRGFSFLIIFPRCPGRQLQRPNMYEKNV